MRIQKRFLSNLISLPVSADVVIIGGGVAGSNTLYQFAKRNINAVLIEREKITCGTSWHSAGLVWGLRPCDAEIKLLEATKRIFNELGTESSWIENGGLFIARRKDRLEEYKRLQTIGRFFGISSDILSPADAVKLFPSLDEHNFYAALYIPSDGSINSEILCNSLIRRATLEGYAKVIENCPIKNILTSSKSGIRKITGVQTCRGIIKTSYVINCMGIWSNSLMNSLGIDIPLLPIKHAYITTEKISNLKSNTPNLRDYDSSLYFRVRNGSISMGGYENNPEFLNEIPNDLKFDDLDLNLSNFKKHIEKASDLWPGFENLNFKNISCGPESFTPDHKPILGEDPIVKGLFHNCGYNSTGIMLGGGCAEQLAYWVIHGRPEMHMAQFDIRRFTPLMRRDSTWIKERTHESYKNVYKIVFENDQPLAGRELVTDVFHDDLIDHGAFMEEKNGWEKPSFFLPDNETAPIPKYDWYGCYGFEENKPNNYYKWLEKSRSFSFSDIDDIIEEEVIQCRKNGSIFNLSYFTKLYLTGPEASKAADWLFTAHINSFDPEDYVYTCMLNKNGNVEADLNVMTLNQGMGTLIGPILKGRGYYIVAGGIMGYNIQAHLKQEIDQKGFKAVITDVTSRMGILSIQGPKSREILQGVTESPITDDQFPLATSRLVSIDGEICRAIRTSFIGELGFQLHIPIAACAPIYRKITEIASHFRVKNAGFRALYTLNGEKCKHLCGLDLRSDDNPIEANLGHYCRTDGNYLGKKTVDICRNIGTTKLRAIFTIDNKIAMFGLETIWRNGEIIGYLRRAHYGYNFKKSIGIGYIEHPRKEMMTDEYIMRGHYEIEVMGQKYEAQIHLQTFFDPKNMRMREIYDKNINESLHFQD